MTMQVRVMWTCNGCDAEIVKRADEQPPDGWVGVEIYDPPRGAERFGERRHYCLECGVKIGRAVGFWPRDVAAFAGDEAT